MRLFLIALLLVLLPAASARADHPSSKPPAKKLELLDAARLGEALALLRLIETEAKGRAAEPEKRIADICKRNGLDPKGLGDDYVVNTETGEITTRQSPPPQPPAKPTAPTSTPPAPSPKPPEPRK